MKLARIDVACLLCRASHMGRMDHPLPDNTPDRLSRLSKMTGAGGDNNGISEIEHGSVPLVQLPSRQRASSLSGPKVLYITANSEIRPAIEQDGWPRPSSSSPSPPSRSPHLYSFLQHTDISRVAETSIQTFGNSPWRVNVVLR